MKGLRFESRVECPFSAATEFAQEYFEQRVPGVLRVPLRFGPLKIQLNRGVSTGVAIYLDHTDPARKHEALAISMRPLGGLPFPEFRSALTVRPFMPPGTLIALELSYQPPLGVAGRLLDAVAGRLVAAAIGRALLDDLSAYLVARAREYASELETFVN